MTTLVTVLIGYTCIWFLGLYFILHRLYVIRNRTKRRVHDYDEDYVLPTFRKPWIYTVIFGFISYGISIMMILLFLKP